MNYFPIFIAVKNKPCLVVGGGDIALRKINLLLNAGALVDCLALTFCAQLTAQKEHQQLTLINKKFSSNDVQKPYCLIIAATNDEALNHKISTLAKQRNIPVNVVDSLDLSDFLTPSIVDRSPLTIAISSSGRAPVLARLLRTKLEGILPSGYGRLATLAGNYRQQVKDAFTNISQRRRFWQDVLTGPIAERALRHQLDEAEKLLQQAIAKKRVSTDGEVYLVGAGPGDADLLTFKALRLMQQADVVLYDRLVSKEVMQLVRRDAELIYVGKKKGKQVMPQQRINQLLIELAKKGKQVCRLKGGDPFIFARGGEEIEALAENNMTFQVVPGITAASGCLAYAGIPLTHRDYAHSCRFIAGHLKNGVLDLPWSELVSGKQTLVFYMGLAGAKYIGKKLLAHGMATTTPVALIEQGTTERQQVYTSALSKLPTLLTDNTIKPPTLLVVGQVVMLRAKLNWFK